MKPASLFPALEKACPKHRNLMNRLYHKIDDPSPLKLGVLEEDDIDRIAAAFDECCPLGDRRAERIFRMCYEVHIDNFSPAVRPSHLLRIIRESESLHRLNINRKHYIELSTVFGVPKLNIPALFEHVDQCIGIAIGDGFTTVLFDDDTAAVRAKLQLCDFLL